LLLYLSEFYINLDNFSDEFDLYNEQDYNSFTGILNPDITHITV